MNDVPKGDIFCLARVDGREWRIFNRRYAADDERYRVAQIKELDDDEVEVEWAEPIPLPTVYRTVMDALDDVTRWGQRSDRTTRPIPIPHLPPPPQPPL